ncbi:Hypothetical_protein [Hexamita inflata]|uniref:Hypothetical_protein n=1 Tax=Hexamita inflata TaxID=28002 RepID=A0AA86R2I5_9EUKA|nr:Hypothetical protein HINF_LOCUS55693 [Hexamita inflata]
MFTLLSSLAIVCDKPSTTTNVRYICGQNTACDASYNCIFDASQAACNVKCAAAKGTTKSCINTNMFTMDSYPNLDSPSSQSVYYCPSTNLALGGEENEDLGVLLGHVIGIPVFCIITFIMHIYCFKHRKEWAENNRVRAEKKLLKQQEQLNGQSPVKLLETVVTEKPVMTAQHDQPL